MGSNSSGWFSNEEMLASIDPEKMHNMSVQKRITAQVALNCRLTLAMYSRGRVRSKFRGISYSDCKNLFAHVCSATKFPNPVAFNPFLRDLVKELRSMLQEFESSSKSITSEQTLESNGILLIPAKQIAKGSYHNSGEQH
ncbi:hypothetical protein L6164_001306 [Bauhinia variegata]|uniref:Uncharacterized protein n=1 Tax=Bauhinia variegata TaxID=167791 RepID=A0ACB9Q942_BAUVA|nr:hypothetical protein L6164_001306 [Bauhinia variegata]